MDHALSSIPLDPDAESEALRERMPLPHSLRDFTATNRMLTLAALAAVIGAIGAVLAWALLKLIAFFTNLFYFQTLSFADASPADNTLGWLALSCRSWAA